jgi:hypothetical protein
MLVVNQRRRQHFGRKRQELGTEGAGHDRRKLDQIRNFLEEGFGLRVVLDERAAADLPRARLELAHHAVTPFDAREDDEVLGQLLPVLVERSHLDGAPRATARREEPVAIGDGSRRDVLDTWTGGVGLPRDGEGHDAPAV